MINEALYELKKLCSISVAEMDKISNTIKEVEKVFQDSLPLMLVKVEHNNFELLWDGHKDRLLIKTADLFRPLIECPFVIRKIIIEGNVLEELILKINKLLTCQLQ